MFADNQPAYKSPYFISCFHSIKFWFGLCCFFFFFCLVLFLAGSWFDRWCLCLVFVVLSLRPFTGERWSLALLEGGQNFVWGSGVSRSILRVYCGSQRIPLWF